MRVNAPFVRTTVIGGLLGISLLGMATPGHAQLVDPATLFVGNGAKSSCPTGAAGTTTCPFLVGGEVGGFQTQLDLYQNSGGASSLNTPVLLIFGVAND